MLLQATRTAPPPPLAPSGKWTIEHDENACVLVRRYGTAPALTRVGFNPSPLGNDVAVVLLATAARGPVYRKVKGMTLTTLTAEAAVVTERASASAATVEAADGTRRSFALPGMARAFVALGTCQGDLLKG